MKKAILISFASILMLACRKEILPDTVHSTFVRTIKADLKDSLSDVDFANIDIKKATLTYYNILFIKCLTKCYRS